MGRFYIGDFPFTGLLEAGIAGPIDARYVVDYYLDLTNSDTWPAGSTGEAYIYDGMQVYVKDEKKVYILTDVDNYTSEEAWKELASDVEGTSIDIENNLNSTRPDAALSANQGRILNETIISLEERIFDDSGEKIDSSLLPQFNTGLLYGGTIDSKRVCVLTKALKDKLELQETVETRKLEELSVEACENVYFIAKEAGNEESLPNTNNLTVPRRSAGDWIISTGKKWDVISSNAVTSVVGKTGTITAENLIEALEYDEDANTNGFLQKADITNLEKQANLNGRNIAELGVAVTTIQNKLTWQKAL